MPSDHDDPLIDSLLDEVVGGRTPPDLSSKIMLAWSEGPSASAERAEAWPPNAALPLAAHGADVSAPEPPPIIAALSQVTETAGSDAIVEFSGGPAIHRGRSNRSSQHFLTAAGLAVVAAVVLMGLAIAVVANRPRQGDRAGAPTVVIAPKAPGIHKASPSTPATVPAPDAIAATPDVRQSPRVESPTPANAPIERPTERAVADNSTPAAVAPPIERRYLRPSADREIVSFVNAELTRTWQQAGVKPTPAVSDAEWCQRLFAEVIGRAPTAEELKSFTDDKSANRREKLVDQLLTDSKYTDEYARHWAGMWTAALVGRTQGPRRDELRKHLQAALAANKPYDELVQELLTATGSATPGNDDFNPAVNFLLDGMDANAVVPTARVARVFLGHQLQCAQCHDHPTQGWKQEQFWALNGFLRQLRVDRTSDTVKLVNADFAGQGRASPDGAVFFETPDGLLKTALPRFLDGTEIPASGELAKVDRRRELARLVVQSDDLPKATVNRLWAQIYGYGFMRPVDDLGTSASTSQPAVLDRLATEFAAHDFDLKSVIRWAVLSEPFKRSSTLTDLTSKDMPEAGEIALFSRFYSRPPQGANVFRSLVQAGQIRKTGGSKSDVERARIDWLAQFNRGAAKDIAKANSKSELMVKGADPARSVSVGPAGAMLKKITATKMPFERKVEHLFLAAIARPPVAREQQATAELLKSSGGDQRAALEDLWWALLTSNECVIE